jgi:glycerophosphoryl diester phosphodiesterase
VHIGSVNGACRHGAALTSIVLIGLASLAAAPAAHARIEVQGHRGARAARPENTLPAFEYALEQGVDTLELDLAVTKDGVLVVSHEPLVSPEICQAAGGKPVEGQIPIHGLTLAELRTYDCGTLRNPRFPDQTPVPGTRVPTLEEVFQLVKDSPSPAAKVVQFNIEIKIVPRYAGTVMPDPDAFAKLVVDAVHKAGLVDRVVIQSFDHRSLLAVRKLEKRLRISPLVGDSLPELKGYLAAMKPDVYSPNLNWITPEAVKTAHAAGTKVIPWTADAPDEWEYLVKCGVDGIITDDPARLIAWLKERKLR